MHAVLWLAASLTHGAAVGDVTATSAILWSRASEAAEIVFEVDTAPDLPAPQRRSARAEPGSDFTVQVRVSGLSPGTRYHYRVVIDDGGEPARGSFRTAPDAEASEPLRFVVMGDLGGHGYCREVAEGYAIFGAMADLEPDFLIANGDMIYADSACPEGRPEGGRNLAGNFPRVDAPEVDWTDGSAVREIYRAHWRYNRADSHFQRLLAQTSMYSQWDDHEVINDFGGAWQSLAAAEDRPGYPTLVTEGRRALFDYHPMARHPDEPERIYRSFRWGAEAELFLLDARSYRSLNELPDVPDHRKTLLGSEQLSWLADGLAASTATWKIVSTDVPLSIPTGSFAHLLGRDAFADGTALDYSSRTGFERELTELLTELDRRDVRNVVFVATDVHFAASLRYDRDLDGDGDRLLFHELISGPLSAAKLAPVAPDPSFAPAILFAEGQIFNFSFVRIESRDGTSHLIADVRDETGAPRFGSELTLRAH